MNVHKYTENMTGSGLNEAGNKKIEKILLKISNKKDER